MWALGSEGAGGAREFEGFGDHTLKPRFRVRPDHRALGLGLRDYIRGLGFRGLGLELRGLGFRGVKGFWG